MQNTFYKSPLALTLLVYALACLALIVYLTHFPLTGTKLDRLIPDLSSSTRLPDFSAIEQTPERKQAFIEMLLPLIEEKNNALLKTRSIIVKLQQQVNAGSELSNKQNAQLERLRDRYNIKHETYPETAQAIEILLLRVDVIPQSMVLAQAAVESGWGTSRFAEEGHNLFGQWCYKPGCGIVPARRPASARHEVRVFADVEAAINAYYKNINTHTAYRQLRQLRAQLRAQDGEITGTELVAGLEKYSGRGAVYIDELRTMIRVNDLENWQMPDTNLAAQP